MLTNNWYKVLAALFGYNSNDIKCKSVDGSNTDTSSNPNDAGNLIPSKGTSLGVNSTMKSLGIYFGDGDTAPTKEDYRLSGNVITSLNLVNTKASTEVDGSTYKYVLTLTLKNTGSSDITISEAAWVSYSVSNYVMFDRTLLSTPITIPAGDTGVVVYTRSITIPS